jgi:uncharacterized membrane protein YfhO
MVSDQFDPLHDVILDAPALLDSQGSLRGHSMIELYENRRVVIQTQLSAPGVLVLTDAFYPGWRVFINGTERTIRRANHLFRGVELPEGIHQVEFVYDPLSFKLGLTISLCSIAALILAGIIRRVRSRHNARFFV